MTPEEREHYLDQKITIRQAVAFAKTEKKRSLFYGFAYGWILHWLIFEVIL